MRTEYLPISNLKTTVSVGGDIDVELVQRDTVGVTCMIEGGKPRQHGPANRWPIWKAKSPN